MVAVGLFVAVVVTVIVVVAKDVVNRCLNAFLMSCSIVLI